VQGIPGLLLNAAAVVLLVLGGVGVILGALMRADSATILPPATFTITLGSVFASFGLLFLCIPGPQERPAARGQGRDSRLEVLSHLVFPIGIWLLSARLLGVVEYRLSSFLQDKVVGFVSLVFDLAGATLTREGNVLLLATGSVGVAEACSGIRSLTGCLFSGALLGAVFFRSLAPKILLLLAAVLMAFLTNLARNLFLTFWAYRHGPAAIHGWVHDVTGYAVLGLSTLGLVLIVGGMKRLGSIRIEFAGSEPNKGL
jgi:exosortase/archaeosortase family protein